MRAPAEIVPGYLGRVLSSDCLPVGTCFQVGDGVIVTARHVIADALHEPGEVDDEVLVNREVLIEELTPGSRPRSASVLRAHGGHDLAVLRTGQPFPASVPGFARSDLVPGRAHVQVLGMAALDAGDPYRYASAIGTWEGPTMRGEKRQMARLLAQSVVNGMSGAPVRRAGDDWVVGVVSETYKPDPEGRWRDAVWVARVENLLELLDGLATVRVDDGMSRIRDYVHAAARVAKSRPYLRIRQATPSLATVYLDGYALPHAPRADPDGLTPEPDLPLGVSAKALTEMREDCLVVAGPGMGKTSLLQSVLLTAARTWQDHGVGTQVPVLLLATDLLARSSLPELIAEAVRKDLHGPRGKELSHSFPKEFFEADPGPGIRWLLLVDGIDEILDTAGRKQVLDILAFIAGPERQSQYRIIAATRPLSEAEMRDAFGAGDWHPRGFELRPFAEPRVQELAQRWFEALRLPDPAREAERFTARLASSRLTAIAGTPLMAAMLCQIHAADRDPAKLLPTTRGEIYSQFVELLHANVRDPHERDEDPILDRSVSVLRKRSSAAATAAGQVLDGLRELIAGLAAERRAGNGRPALDIIAADPDAREPAGVRAGEWRDFLYSVLLRSGLLDIRGGDFVFLHRTLMDYLVARYKSDRPRAIRDLLKVRGTRRFPLWREPREDPSFVSFILDPGTTEDRYGAPKPTSGITEREIQRLLLRLARKAGLKGMDFIGEQIRLGTAVPDKVRVEVAASLESIARAANEADFLRLGDSITAACILADIDFGTGLAVLESLALDIDLYARSCLRGHSISDNAAFEAVREVVALDRSRGTALLRTLARGPDHDAAADGLLQRRQVEAARMLAELDSDTAVELLESMAKDDHLGVASRIEATAALMKLNPAPRAGFYHPSIEFLTVAALNTGNGAQDRVAAARVLARLNPQPGTRLLEEAVRAAISEALQHQESWQEIHEGLREIGLEKNRSVRKLYNPGRNRDNLRREAEKSVQVMMDVDKEAATRMLEQILADRNIPGTDHDWVAALLEKSREYQGFATDHDADLADIDPEWLRGQLLGISGSIISGPKGRRSHVADGELPAHGSGDTVPASIIPSLQHPAAAALLRSLARNDAYPSRDRFPAIYQLAAFRDPAAQELLESFIRERGNDFYYRLRAITALGSLDPDSALVAIEIFADEPYHYYIQAIAAAAEWDLPGTRRRLKEMLKEIPVWHIYKQLCIRSERLTIRSEWMRHL